MPDRRFPPPIQPVHQVQLPPVEVVTLSQGVPLYRIAPGGEEVLRLDILIDAGRPRERFPLAAKATGALLREGTTSYTGAQIAEQLDFYGASLSTPFQMDGIHLVLYTLTRHARAMLPLVASVLLEPTFPEAELENLKSRYAQNLEVELRKTDVVAYRELTSRLFGEAHPYGYNSSPEGYRRLGRETVLDHYQRHFTSGNIKLLLSGGDEEGLIDLLDELICRALPSGSYEAPEVKQVDAPPGGVYRETLRPSVQTAVRLGCRVPNRHHPDFPGLFLLNTILGGYFGSRLMANIREEKGYTYNIYSSLDSFRFDGYFYIGTEVGHAFVEDTLREIRREVRGLQEQPVAEEELQMVRNYIMGNFLSLLDGPFQTADLIKGLLLEELPLGQFDEWVERIKRTDAGAIQRLAEHYLQPDQMWEVIVGDPPA